MSEITEAVREAIECELQLLAPEMRRSPELLGSLLHPEFTEFGYSGRRWDRDSIIAELTGRPGPAIRPVTTRGMQGVQLADDLVHLTFDTDHNGRLAHRSSLWRHTDEGWLLWFHQATPFSNPQE